MMAENKKALQSVLPPVQGWMDAPKVRSAGSNRSLSSHSALQPTHHSCFDYLAYCVVSLSFIYTHIYTLGCDPLRLVRGGSDP